MDEYEFILSDKEGGTRTIAFPSRRFVVGAGSKCELRFSGVGLFAAHAEVLLDHRGQPWVKDLTGRGQVWVNSVATPQSMIPSGTLVRLGELELTVHLQSSAALGETSRTPSVETSRLLPGTIIDQRYRVVRKLAAGGMGEVYQAEHIQLGKAMAIKVMRPEMSRDPDFVARFKREAVAASRIGQQNIVDISDFGQTDDGRFYFAMEYLDGETLGAVVHREGAMQLQRAVGVAVQVARARVAAHSLGVVHRDMKPENVMLLQRPGQPDLVKVLDFGVAKVATGQGDGGHTAIGMVVGTPQYMSPEQAKGIAVDARTDIYALGLILYELIAGRPTFSGETMSSLMVKQVTEPPSPLEPGPLSEVPGELEELVFRMLEKDPAARPQTMDEVAEQLASVEAKLRAKVPLRVASSMATPSLPRTAVKVSGRHQSLVPPQRAKPRAEPPEEGGRTDEGEMPREEGETPDDDLELPGQTASRARWIGLAAVVVVVVVAAGAAFLLRGSSPSAVAELEVRPPPAREALAREVPVLPPLAKVPVLPPLAKAPVPEPAVAQKVTRRVDSKPSGADVYKDGALIGRTPLDVMGAEAEEVALRFVIAQHEEASRTVSFRSKDELVVELKPKAAAVRPTKPRQPVDQDDDEVLIDRPRAR